ncbi:MAG: hypothetical protein H6R16_3807 [Proteobacteria bacterium]|nr:hypothetical protein [Pseudomonadota bacterium]
MPPISETFLMTHTFELRLLLAVTVFPATYAVIQLISFISRIAAKLKHTRSNDESVGAYSAAGAR